MTLFSRKTRGSYDKVVGYPSFSSQKCHQPFNSITNLLNESPFPVPPKHRSAVPSICRVRSKAPAPAPLAISLTAFQMAPHNEQSMEAITGKDFFNTVSRDGYPSAKPKAQPWKDVWNGAKPKDVQADGRMLVACSLRHDYGMLHFHAPHLIEVADLCRFGKPWRLLALFSSSSLSITMNGGLPSVFCIESIHGPVKIRIRCRRKLEVKGRMQNLSVASAIDIAPGHRCSDANA